MAELCDINSDYMDSPLRQDEYTALRATIKERGTVRTITFLATAVAWAAIEIVFAASRPDDIVGTLVSLMVLVAGFESIFQMHLGVERIGRYLQVHYEEPSDGAEGERDRLPAWETTAMAYGAAHPKSGSDPLFTTIFVLATFINLLPVLRAAERPAVFAALALPHLAFLIRMRIAKHQSASQRAEDLERFRQLRR